MPGSAAPRRGVNETRLSLKEAHSLTNLRLTVRGHDPPVSHPDRRSLSVHPDIEQSFAEEPERALLVRGPVFLIANHRGHLRQKAEQPRRVLVEAVATHKEHVVQGQAAASKDIVEGA